MKKTVKLGTMGDIFIGLTYHPDDVSSEGTIVLRSSNIQDGRLDFSDVVRVKCSIRDNLFVKQNDILMCSRNGSAKLVGKCALLPRMDEKMTFGAFMTIIRTEHNEYLLHFFNSNAFRNQLGSAATTTINQITRKMLDDICVPLYDNEKEHHITSKFNKIDALIHKKQQQLSKLDELVKSRFIELFGDPRINPKGYKILPISALFDVGSSKRVFESEWRESGVPFYRAREIVKLSRDGFVDNELFIEEEMYESYKKKYGVPRAGDMMVTGVGTLGVCYIVKETDRFYFKDGNTLWFKNKGLCDVRFIKDQYETDFVRDQIVANANISTVGTYTITNANNTMVLVPPVNEQLKYVEFCRQVDKSKLAIQKSLEKLEILKKSLMQQYCG